MNIEKDLDKITLDNKEFFILGTAHISIESVNQVKSLIENEDFDIICIELDSGRLHAIENPDDYSNLNVFQIIKENKTFLFLSNLILSSFQKRLGDNLDIKPGQDMKQALISAKEKNIDIALCDREIQITLKRGWNKSSFLSKYKMASLLFESFFSNEKIDNEELERIKSGNEIEKMLNELSKQIPEIKTVIIDERDKYLASKIYNCIDNKEDKKKILAVVGAGHKKGIIEYINKFYTNELDLDLKEIEIIPPKSNLSKIFPYILTIFLIFLLSYNFIKGDTLKGIDNIYKWILINGSFTVVGALLALAHPLVIIASFFISPIASLTPLIGTGIVSGLLQAYLAKPKIKDFENLKNDCISLKSFYKNKISKALLVSLTTTLGSMIATFIAIPFLF